MEMSAETHTTIGRIDANVSILLSMAGAHDHRISVIEKRQWISIGGLAIGAALLLPRLKELFEPITAAFAH